MFRVAPTRAADTNFFVGMTPPSRLARPDCAVIFSPSWPIAVLVTMWSSASRTPECDAVDVEAVLAAAPLPPEIIFGTWMAPPTHALRTSAAVSLRIPFMWTSPRLVRSRSPPPRPGSGPSATPCFSDPLQGRKDSLPWSEGPELPDEVEASGAWSRRRHEMGEHLGLSGPPDDVIDEVVVDVDQHRDHRREEQRPR